MSNSVFFIPHFWSGESDPASALHTGNLSQGSEKSSKIWASK